MKKINWQYTLGEILIVIIGITIAFSMNKCSELKTNETLKTQYLSNIKQDIEADKKTLQENANAIGAKIQTLNGFMPLLNTENPEKIKRTQELFSVFGLSSFFPKDITYQTMVNSGDYKLIDDFKIKSAIESHYSSYKSILKDYERLEIIHREYLGDYLINHVNYDLMRQGQFAFQDETLLKNILQSIYGALIIKKNATERGIENCNGMLSTLSTY
uniref:DUF6090 family protein n=1 Tax=Psychroserpens sp. XS_ASV72 TaxID=3241293 RepID=UPI00351454AC